MAGPGSPCAAHALSTHYVLALGFCRVSTKVCKEEPPYLASLHANLWPGMRLMGSKLQGGWVAAAAGVLDIAVMAEGLHVWQRLLPVIQTLSTSGCTPPQDLLLLAAYLRKGPLAFLHRFAEQSAYDLAGDARGCHHPQEICMAQVPAATSCLTSQRCHLPLAYMFSSSYLRVHACFCQPSDD